MHCINQASLQYHVKKSEIIKIIKKNKIYNKGIGEMGIPDKWIPILLKAGFSYQDILENKCINIAAGTWILRYMNKGVERTEMNQKKINKYIHEIIKYYPINKSKVEKIIKKNETRNEGIGIMGIPESWLPILKDNGFNIFKIKNNEYWNIAAGSWILLKLKKTNKIVYESDQPFIYSEIYFNSIKKYFIKYGNMYHVSPSLLEGIAFRESGFNPQAVSDKGAEGLMQFIPSTAKVYGIENPFNAKDEIIGASKYMHHLLKEFNNNKSLAIAAYNAGSHAVNFYKNIPPFPETEEYVPKVLSSYHYFKNR